jgi:hypothetical protein
VGEMKCYDSNLSCRGRRAKRAGCGRARSQVFVLDTLSLKFAKAGSAATLPQQEKNNTVDLQRGRAKFCRHYANIGKSTLAAMYLRRGRVAGRSFAAAPTHVSPRTPAAQNLATFFQISVISCFLNKFEKRNGEGLAGITTTTTTHAGISTKFLFSPGANSAEPPCSVASFVVNLELHTGARPSVRLCVGLTKKLSRRTAHRR